MSRTARAAAPPPVSGSTSALGLTTPAAGIPHEFRNLVFGEILVFIAILAAAYAYAWRKGVFEWR
jgi:NADH-quinone oxidoreductase subunit A